MVMENMYEKPCTDFNILLMLKYFFHYNSQEFSEISLSCCLAALLVHSRLGGGHRQLSCTPPLVVPLPYGHRESPLASSHV